MFRNDANKVTNDARKKGKCAIALFLDFSKAFDQVNRIKLWYRLIKNTSSNYWLMLKNYYKVMIMFVENENGEFCVPFWATVGVKQGGNASPSFI